MAARLASSTVRIALRARSKYISPVDLARASVEEFSAEYTFQIANPVRILAFFDAGQVRNEGERFRSSAFVASTGGEVRFFMPVLNVPFRLIFARNINRDGILDNNYEPEKKWRFRFAVGSTF